MVIVGAGKAGARAAVVLRDSGWQGAITLIGEEGHPPYDRPPLSKSAITDDEETAPTLLARRGHHRLAQCHMDRQRPRRAYRPCGARQLILADGRRVAYDKLLIATGAAPRKLPLPGAERALMLRTFDDMQALRQKFQPGVSVAIIGGGFIGLELGDQCGEARLRRHRHRSAAAHSAARRAGRDRSGCRQGPCGAWRQHHHQCADRSHHRPTAFF